jgi:hypothetical protein
MSTSAKREVVKARPRKDDGRRLSKSQIAPQLVAAPDSKRSKINKAKAAASKTNRGTVERMDALMKKRPDLAAKVKSGELPAAWQLRKSESSLHSRQIDGVN